MPELPEVEVTRLGVAPHVEGQEVTSVVLRREGLRWPFPANLEQILSGKRILKTSRRGKYLLLHFDHGVLLVHLGMTGNLRVMPTKTPAQKHDHVDLAFGKQMLRLTDPRRFGALLWHSNEDGAIEEHLLLRKLGVEPLESGFSAELLFKQSRSRTAPIKQVLLSGDIVVGVGNIYASESLFRAKINPKTPANRIGLKRYQALELAIRQILAEAITKGGSTLKDFVGADGKTGYFQQSYFVYDRAGEPCRVCQGTIRHIMQGQRSSFYCVNCQK
ncbi:bifunctional DNA-formamidopyrimidine glycosylase/DNA-(apurinic or apyrimidinic site) lyase [Undibacterium sp. LX40W]|uniref:Formamidopyrimidine-DNA glycosylase n=1 Tax=Undibacterium nitidum TaxID=2762298 RepID=A0A923HKE2_9BURK|nr:MULTISPECIES: bifunctional DNA-formamidopyrimidine glycosylase/DNA-(apurinic or apyrimidinic site) lyase [Undibacterium]MBC3881014.1 bifunctional DNA-formamidopyrimidine glycosylase/DNA-(apurinic or apyrimidinic site) lyase [Undibacterium nitidum]MBC3890253.1 bifunctional DNA-formamidopyrimidine glycosylase/DNA-(apurinic or apyrimidinic site) lyase [Undibacterium sp. LX40W]